MIHCHLLASKPIGHGKDGTVFQCFGKIVFHFKQNPYHYDTSDLTFVDPNDPHVYKIKRYQQQQMDIHKNFTDFKESVNLERQLNQILYGSTKQYRVDILGESANPDQINFGEQECVSAVGFITDKQPGIRLLDLDTSNFDDKQLWHLCSALLQSVSDCHEKQIAHGDLHRCNVLIELIPKKQY